MKYFKKVEGKNVYLSPMCVEDAPKYTKWFNDRSNSDGLHYTCNLVGVEKVNKIESNVKENIGVEGIEISEKVSFTDKNNNVKDIFFMSHEAFRNVSLPVVARNCLENGKSVNLWYEEIVPHKSLFYFVVMEEDSDKDCLDLFINTVNEKIIQFGGNASIGYGLCKVSVTEGKNNE